MEKHEASHCGCCDWPSSNSVSGKLALAIEFWGKDLFSGLGFHFGLFGIRFLETLWRAFRRELALEASLSMATPGKCFTEIVYLLKSCFPRRTEAANVSSVAWMPDHMVRVCYDCDSRFTVFNRRHHCRLCGRIFCGNCTAHSIPAAPCDKRKIYREDEWENARVCGFCFGLWEQEMAAVSRGLGLSPSSSMVGLASIECTGTGDGSNLNGQCQDARGRPLQLAKFN